MAATLYFQHQDQNQKKFTENLGSVTYTIAQLQDSTTGAAQNCEKLCRALVGLTKDTYVDVYATEKVDITDIISEG